MSKEIAHPEEVVMEPIHAFVHHAKCPECKTGNLYHQVGVGIAHAANGDKCAPHLCKGCGETINLPDGESYPKLGCGEYGRFNYINRE